MSDYAHNKVIRLPITNEILKSFDCQDIDEFADGFHEFVKKVYPEMQHIGQDTPYFEIGYTDNYDRNYIDLVLYDSYGEECGDWAIASYLSDKEKDFFAPYFDKLGITFDPNDLRKADYCWYNCCEPPDCYDVGKEKDWTLLI